MDNYRDNNDEQNARLRELITVELAKNNVVTIYRRSQPDLLIRPIPVNQAFSSWQSASRSPRRRRTKPLAEESSDGREVNFVRPEYVKKSNIAAISPRSRFRGMAVLSLCKTTILRKFFVENHTTSEAAATHVPASDELEELG